MMADAVPTVPQMGSSFMDEYADVDIPFSPLVVDVKLEHDKLPPARLSGFDGLFDLAWPEPNTNGASEAFVPDIMDTAARLPAALARRSSFLRLAQQLQEDGAAVKSEPKRESFFDLSQLPEVERATPRRRRSSSASSSSSSPPSPSPPPSPRPRATPGVTRPGAMKRVKGASPSLPANHKPARGRGRSKQLAKMSAAQRQAEKADRMEKNRVAAKEFRARRKNRVQALEQSVQEHEQRTRQQQQTILQLQQQVELLKQQLSCQ